MTDIYENIGRQIRTLRGEMSQDALAQELNIAANKLSRWETGIYKPTAEDLDAIARHFKVSITVFFPEHERKEKDDKALEKVAALTSAVKGLDASDIEEVINYAKFRRIRYALETTSKKKKKNKSA